VFHVLAAVAEYDREMIVEGTMDGLAAARSRRRALAAAAGPGPADVRHQRTHRRPRSPKKQLNQVGAQRNHHLRSRIWRPTVVRAGLLGEVRADQDKFVAMWITETGEKLTEWFGKGATPLIT
jgi:DNA invertase Pin-like site-specific DNA recombinase